MRSLAGPLSERPLTHYAPLDREPGALLRSQARSSAPCTLSRYFTTFPPIQTKSISPHPPPARACPFTPLAFARDVPGQTARCPPPRPRGAWKNEKGSRRRKPKQPSRCEIAPGPSYDRPSAHVAPLDREPGALLRSQARSSAPCPLSRYFTTFPPIQTKSISPHPPPARACPFTSHRYRSGRARADSSLPPAPPAGGVEKTTNKNQRKKKIPAELLGQGGRGPVPPGPPALVARLALVSPLILL